MLHPIAGSFGLQKLFKGTDEELSILGRLAAGACAGMTSTLVSHLRPLVILLFSLCRHTVFFLFLIPAHMLRKLLIWRPIYL